MFTVRTKAGNVYWSQQIPFIYVPEFYVLLRYINLIYNNNQQGKYKSNFLGINHNFLVYIRAGNIYWFQQIPFMYCRLCSTILCSNVISTVQIYTFQIRIPHLFLTLSKYKLRSLNLVYCISVHLASNKFQKLSCSRVSIFRPTCERNGRYNKTTLTRIFVCMTSVTMKTKTIA